MNRGAVVWERQSEWPSSTRRDIPSQGWQWITLKQAPSSFCHLWRQGDAHPYRLMVGEPCPLDPEARYQVGLSAGFPIGSKSTDGTSSGESDVLYPAGGVTLQWRERSVRLVLSDRPCPGGMMRLSYVATIPSSGSDVLILQHTVQGLDTVNAWWRNRKSGSNTGRIGLRPVDFEKDSSDEPWAPFTDCGALTVDAGAMATVYGTTQAVLSGTAGTGYPAMPYALLHYGVSTLGVVRMAFALEGRRFRP